MKRIILILCALLALPVLAAKVKVASKGEAVSTIAVDFDAHRTIQFAARELQNYFRQITTARLPVTHRAAGWKNAIFVLGTPESAVMKPFIKGKVARMAAQLKGNGGHAVVVRGNKVLILASTPRGVLDGVHRFILKHTDFIWVRPYKELAHYTADPDLTLEVKDYIDIPKLRERAWSTNSNISYRSEELELYLSRLNNNMTRTFQLDVLGRLQDNGFIMEYGGGHNFSSIWLPKSKYGKTNPEYYMMVNGKRRVTGRLQFCYTNREMWKEFTRNSLEVISKLNPCFNRVTMLIDDIQTTCECPECLKPITLPDGTVITRDDEAFRSTQFYIFLNAVAAEIYKKYPDLQIKCYGYFFTAIPPKVKIFPSIYVSFCPYVRNDKETLHGVSNAKWLERTKRYAAMSPNVIWREYYFCYKKFPRAQANIIAQDLRYINKLGIKMIFPELSWADRPDWPKKSEDYKEQDFYTMCGPEFWTINQLYWDPWQDPDKLRDEYIKRVYMEGAPGVSKFYRLICDSWLKDPSPAAFNDDFRRTMSYYVIGKKLVEPCRAALADAKRTVKDPRAKAALDRLIETFERWLKLSNIGTIAEQYVPKVEFRGMPDFNFDAGVWAKAVKLPAFRAMGRPQKDPAEPTDVKLFHNGEVLYVAYRAPIPQKFVGKAPGKKEFFPSGDHAEIFVTNTRDGYYHLAFNPLGAKYDARGTDPEWNTKWEVKGVIKDGEWRGVAAIPFESIGVVVVQNNRVRFLFHRGRAGFPGKGNVNSSWGGGLVHSPDSFGELVFALE